MPVLTAPITLNDYILGDENAPITLLEYGDYECNLSGLVHTMIKRVQNHFGNKLRFVYRHFPLTQVHPNAEIAAEAAEFAGAHGKFWNMHDLIFESQELITKNLLLDLIESINLSANELKNALENGTYQPKIKADFLSGVRSGVTGTPTFFINGYRYNGALEFEGLVSAIEQTSYQEL